MTTRRPHIGTETALEGMNPPRAVPDIKAIRQAKGWTQRELAAHMGVNPLTVSAWETGRQVPTGSAQVLLRRLAGGR